MKKIKEIYSQPTCDLLVVRFEQNLLTGSPLNSKNTRNRTEYILGGSSVDDYDEL